MSFKILRFFDDSAAENGGGVVTETTPSIAQLMASQGTKSQGGDMVATPININRQVVEDTPQVTETVEETPTATVEETTTTVTEPTVETTPQVETAKETVVETQPQLSWQEVLKQQQPEQILSELGYDKTTIELTKEIAENEKMLAFYKHWKDNGNVKDYLREIETDYSKMPAEEVMRNQLRQEYPNATERQLEILYRKEVIEKYQLDPNQYSEDEVEEGKLLLEAKADKFRNDLILNQSKFLLPTPKQPETVVDNSQEEALKELEAYKSTVNTNPLTQSLINTKSLTVGEGNDKYSLPIQNPQSVLDVLYDTDSWAKSFFDEKDGKLIPNVEKQLFVASAVLDYKSLVNSLINHGKALGKKEAVTPIENIKPTNEIAPTPQSAEPTSIAGLMAKKGTVNTGGRMY